MKLHEKNYHTHEIILEVSFSLLKIWCISYMEFNMRYSPIIVVFIISLARGILIIDNVGGWSF